MADAATGARAVVGAGDRPQAKLGLIACTSLVIGNMIGSGVFTLPASLAPYGGLAIVGWICTTIGAVLLALVFAKLAGLVRGAGGPYVYTRVGFGDFAAFWIAWGYWIAIWAGNAAIAVAMVGYVAVFIPDLATNGLLGGATAVAAVWAVTAINTRGVKSAGAVQTITTIIKLIPLVAVATIGLLYVNREYLAPRIPVQYGDNWVAAIGAVMTLTLWAYLGLESATVPGDDVEQPERTIPRATIMGTLIAAAVYILGSIAVLGVVPPAELARSTAPYAAAASLIWGPWAAYLVAAGAAVSCFGALNGFTLLQGQVPMAAARDGLFPAAFGRMNAANVPAWGTIVSSVLVTILLALNYIGQSGEATTGLVAIFNFIILLATLTTLVPYAFCSMAEIVIFLTDRERFSGQRLTGSIVIASLAFAYSLFTVYGSGAQTVLYGFLLLLLGLPVYVWLRKEQRTQALPTPPATAGAAAD